MAQWKKYDDVLHQRERGYSHNFAQIRPFGPATINNTQPVALTYEDVFDTVYEKVIEIMDDVAALPGRQIDEFYIGKSHARRKQRLGHYLAFHPTLPHTWKLDNGVNGRWNSFYKGNGFDGLVVVACITRDLVQENVRDHLLGRPQQYALALEQQLMKTLLFDDTREISNETFATGKMAAYPHAGIVYVAFKTCPTGAIEE